VTALERGQGAGLVELRRPAVAHPLPDRDGGFATVVALVPTLRAAPMQLCSIFWVVATNSLPAIQESAMGQPRSIGNDE
jgi:hypothetical protein